MSDMRPARLTVLMLATPEIDHYADYTSQSWAAYCQMHGYRFERVRSQQIHDMHIYWSKIACLVSELETSQSDWVFVVDADTIVHTHDYRLETLIEDYASNPQIHILISEDCSRRLRCPIPLSLKTVTLSKTWRGANSGFFGFRVNAHARMMAKNWLALGRGRFARYAFEAPHEQAVFWAGMMQLYRSHIQVIGPEVMRIGGNPFLDRYLTDITDAFVLHDAKLKQLSDASACL